MVRWALPFSRFVRSSSGNDSARASQELPLVFEDDFEQGCGHWEPHDPNAWRVDLQSRGYVYSQFRQSDYVPPHRSPVNISLVRDLVVGDFTFHADLQSTVDDYPHRDLCVFFGYQDAAHFYYVHLGKVTDDCCNQILVVDGAPRTKITSRTTSGTNWDDQWHHVKIVRRVDPGTIEVYFDDMGKPVMFAEDRRFRWGRVGIGSFDETGNWGRVRVYGALAGGTR